MSKRLSDNISSQYVSAANRLNSRTARRRIVAYVESYDDVFIWRAILSRLEDQTRRFEVMLPSRLPHLERGKKAALMSLLRGKVGKDMIACVDADYDYLLQGRTQTSASILQNPYVFHTYAYAIENLQCYAPSLHDVCVAATLNDQATFDFETYLREYSEAVFPLFVWSIWAYRNERHGQFSLSDFVRVVEPGAFSLSNWEEHLANLRRKVGRQVIRLQRENPTAKASWQQVKDDIKRLGVTPQTTYFYVQGHYLADRVVLPMLKKICNTLIRQRETEISRQSAHSTQRRNEISCYESSLADVALTLKKNTGFLDSEPCRRITADLKRFLDGDQPQSATAPAAASSARAAASAVAPEAAR